ncbi:MAG: hypothetical protein A2293_10430 [Elusimicrobia bacterium RIFOXYB2_FULL_49_7]|nr:MAG: hypothetical protein A2293_10430 [Elusimicrobia bacterium RIFOXYB2_FULL_49_7]
MLPEADVVSFFGTDEPGFYQVRLPHGQEEYYAVNVDPVESDPALMDSLALNRLLSGTPWVMLSARDHLSGVILRPKPLWPYFFCAALLFALLESLLCASGLPKQNQETGHQDG